MRTVGRYMVANIDKARSIGHGAAMGYTDSLPEACAEAHTFGSSAHPVGVYDSEIRRGDDGIDVQLVHVTHGNLRFLRSLAAST